MQKVRILIPLTIQFSVRYILRTGLLSRIKNYADPIIILGWEEPELKCELEQLGIEVHQNPGKQEGLHYSRTRKRIDLWHFDHLGSPSTAIDRRRNALDRSRKILIRNGLRDSYYRLSTANSLLVKNAQDEEDKLLRTETNFQQHLKLIELIKPDAVLSITPYLFEEELLLRAANIFGSKIIASILSFDNITTRGWMPLIFDQYCLWNHFNKNELLRIYPDASKKPIHIVGAPQFDFYYDPTYIWNETDWRRNLGVPQNAPIILFGSTGKVVAPHEEQWVYDLDQAIEKKQIKDDPIILMRSHPVDPASRWEPLRKITRHVVYEVPWKLGKKIPAQTNIMREDIEKLTSTLKYSAVHINASSTMTVDGAIFDRPQIGPAYDPDKKYDRSARELYLREHYLPITNSGGLEIAYNKFDLAEMVNQSLEEPDLLHEGRKKIISEICTYDDGRSTERVANAIFDFVTIG